MKRQLEEMERHYVDSASMNQPSVAQLLQAKLLRCNTNFNREQAERALERKSEGTYLIRPSSTGEYALSIVYHGTVQHVIIKEEGGNYGFAKPFKFKSIGELIDFYETKSLRRHNCQFDVVLKTPFVRSEPPSIVKHIKRFFCQ